MRILGLTHPVGADSAACLIVDGTVVACCEEERFSRQKHSPNQLPLKSASNCLERHALAWPDLSAVAVGNAAPSSAFRIKDASVTSWLGELRALFDFHDKRLRAFRSCIYVNHHRAHALSIVPYLEGKEANLLVVDGWGGDGAGALFLSDGTGGLKTLLDIPIELSLGLFYQAITAHLGFVPHSQEGKTMALAAYAEPDSALLPDWCDTLTGLPDLGRYVEYLGRSTPRSAGAELTVTHKTLAATAQYYLERCMVRLARFAYDRTGVGHFGLAGGVALNCVANGRLAQESFVSSVFAHPLSNDAGTALGSAVSTHLELTGILPKVPLDHVYLGPVYSEVDVAAFISFAKLTLTSCDPAEAVAAALEEGKIVGLFCGPAEVGPRALGARSILARPGSHVTKETVNANVKRRECWRPFAPAVLPEYRDEVFQHGCATSFMTVADKVRSSWHDSLRGVTHIDSTTRPQIVSPDSPGLFLRSLRAFHRRTGVPAVLNTSFNLDDEPIVLRPDHALATFFRSGLDMLAFDGGILSK